MAKIIIYDEISVLKEPENKLMILYIASPDIINPEITVVAGFETKPPINRVAPNVINPAAM